LDQKHELSAKIIHQNFGDKSPEWVLSLLMADSLHLLSWQHQN